MPTQQSQIDNPVNTQVEAEPDVAGSNEAKEELPDKFYDSDLESVNEKDYLSDSEPPEDFVSERKLLVRETESRIYKTILRLGVGLDKPASFDWITLRSQKVPDDKVIPYSVYKAKDLPYYLNAQTVSTEQWLTYHLGIDYPHLDQYVTTMRAGEVAVFEVQRLRVGKSNVKLVDHTIVTVIEVKAWTTVIDLEADQRLMKWVFEKGEGSSRINKYDQVQFSAQLKTSTGELIEDMSLRQITRLTPQIVENMDPLLWKTLKSMKLKEKCRTILAKDKAALFYQQNGCNKGQFANDIHLEVSVISHAHINDLLSNGSLLKRIIQKGVLSTRVDESSLVYYSLRFLDRQGKILASDPSFDGNWWEDFARLEKINCRKNYMDDDSISRLLSTTFQYMRPAEIAEIECYDLELFKFGLDHEEYLTHSTLALPIKMQIRLYNFTPGKTCFNMEIPEKIAESIRKKAIGCRLVKEGLFDRALSYFQAIVSYYHSGDLNQEAYNEKISALMNSILCLSKAQKYYEVIPLCQMILEKPKHGYNQSKTIVRGPHDPKGQVQDTRQEGFFVQNPRIVEKCTYRLAFALWKTTEFSRALSVLEPICASVQEAELLKKDILASQKSYVDKSKKTIKNMFG